MTAIIVYEIAITFETVITVIFWSFLFKPKDYFDIYVLNSILVHSCPLLFLILEFIMTRWLFRFQHFVIVFIPGVLYTGINFLIVKISGNPIYVILKWDSFMSLLISIGIGGLYFGAFVFYWLMTKLRFK